MSVHSEPPPHGGGPYVPSTLVPDAARISPTSHVDPEVGRLVEVVNAMQRMAPAERFRALRYLRDRYE